jgi:hypothetical protein
VQRLSLLSTPRAAKSNKALRSNTNPLLFDPDDSAVSKRRSFLHHELKHRPRSQRRKARSPTTPKRERVATIGASWGVGGLFFIKRASRLKNAALVCRSGPVVESCRYWGRPLLSRASGLASRKAQAGRACIDPASHAQHRNPEVFQRCRFGLRSKPYSCRIGFV